MNAKILSAVLVVFALSACDGKTDSSAGAPDEAGVGQQAKSEKAMRRTTKLVLPIAGGIRVPDNFVVRSRSTKPSAASGMVDRTLRVEYAKMDAGQVDSVLQRSFEKAGFKPMEVAGDDDARVMRDANGIRVRYVITPRADLQITLKEPGAQGLVSFYWKQAQE